MRARPLKKRNEFEYFCYGNYLYRIRSGNSSVLEYFSNGWYTTARTLFGLIPLILEQAKSNFPKAF